MSIKKNAVITGITGQDGAYLAALLLRKGYQVFGTYRRTSSINFWRITELGIKDHANLELVEHDLTDLGSCIRLLELSEADEVYNLAAQSFVAVSFDQPITTAEITGLGATHLLEAIRIVNRKTKYYQASTSEMFGNTPEAPQNENTPFYPRSPYGVAKLYAHWTTINYRDSFDIFASSGILFNHESPLRGLEFVTRKITNGISKIVLEQQEYLELGNLDAKRDWGYAEDYVCGMYQMLQIDTPDTFVLASGRAESVRYFVELTCKAAGIPIAWQGEKLEEVGINTDTGKTIVRMNPKYYRPAEINLLIGNAEKAHTTLGWQHKTDLEGLCQMMYQADYERNRQQQVVF